MITTTTEAQSPADLTADWKIVARKSKTDWIYTGTLTARDVRNDRVSTVTGRPGGGVEVLYGRLRPVEKRA